MSINRKIAPFMALALALAGWTTAAAVDLAKFPLEPAFELAPESTIEPVPLRWAHSWVLVRVKINGVDGGWFKIGTGWQDSSIDPVVAARLGLQEIPQFGLLNQNQQPGSPGANIRIFRADSLQCGQASANDVPLEGFDLSAMSQDSVKMYGEGISGVLGWDLLKTLPFLLDEPGLQLVWQKEAKPADGAERVAMTEKYGCPFAEVTLGDCRTLAMVNTAGASAAVQRPFLKQHAAQLWQGQVCAVTNIFYGAQGDDDALPVGKIVEGWPSSRWLTAGCGGSQESQLINQNPRTELSLGEVQIGYATLRRRQVLFDGPGKSLWTKPSPTVPEITLAKQNQPPPSAYALTLALQTAIETNDPIAVRALAAAGADLKGEPRQEPLPRACRYAAREAVKALIEAGAPVEPPTGQGDTPLLAACESGDPVLVKMLLAKGADANRPNPSGFTPLEAAARHGASPAAVAAVLAKTKFNKDPTFALRVMSEAAVGGNLALAKEMLARVSEEYQPQLDWPKILEQALLLGQQDIAEWVIKTGKPKLTATAETLPPLLAAILPTRIEKTDAIREKLVAMLLAAGADPNSVRKGVTPLLLAARHGNAGIVRQLIAAGAKTTVTDYKQRNALQRAASVNQPADLIAPLLKSGLDLEAIDSETESTALATYARHGNSEACRALLKAGAAPDGRSMFGPPPLSAATNGPYSSDEDALAVVKLLLEHGAKTGAASTEEDFPDPLFGACVKGRSSLIQPLVAAGVPIDKPTCWVTPLGWACVTPSTATVTSLLDLGANPRVIDRLGNTPLNHAAAAGRAENMQLLLARGISPDATDPLGVPPIWVAASCGQTRAVRLLLAAGANPDAIHPVKKTTALEAARSRKDPALVALLEAAGHKK